MDQDEMTEDNAAQEPDPRFLIKVAVAGLALHLAGCALDNAMAGDAAAVVLFAGWLWGGRGAEKVAPSGPRAKGPGSKACAPQILRADLEMAGLLCVLVPQGTRTGENGRVLFPDAS
jgi:hypothetical protein